MKKHFYHILRGIGYCMCLLFAVNTVQAQITLTQASYATWSPGLDSIRSISGVSVTPSANATWDLSGGTYGPVNTFTRGAVSGNSTYPNATYSLLTNYSFNPLLAYNATEMNGLGSAGLMSYGQTIVRQPISLFTLTAGANDSLIFNAQNIVYTSTRKTLAFPATYGSVWTSSYLWDLSFNLTVAGYGLNNVPGIKRAYVTYTDSVTGWGKMRVLNALGQISGYMDVLAVKISSQQKDSFFLGGVPAPTALVTAFGLSQGQLSNSYAISYYRAGEVQPLLSTAYTDNTYTTSSGSTVHAARLAPASTGIPFVPSSDRITIYPNPVVDGGILNIGVDNSNGGNYSYELMSVTGQRVGNGALTLTSGISTVHLDQAGGMYFLRLMNNGQLMAVKKLTIAE